MKKPILNLGKALNKAEQKEINGGTDKGTCMIQCRARYGLYGICIPDSSGSWYCTGEYAF